MKNIGLKLKDKREENGLSIEEVAEDLKMRPSQISSIEEGKTEDFKDVFYLKYFIRDYAKYLGLDSERILDEFNELTGVLNVVNKKHEEDMLDEEIEALIQKRTDAKKNKDFKLEYKKDIIQNYKNRLELLENRKKYII